MTATLPEVVEVDQSIPQRGGLLAAALPAPEGWERGLVIPFYGCGEPELLNGCMVGEDLAKRDGVAAFRSFEIRQGAACSTLSNQPDRYRDHARGRLDATSEWGLGRQFATDFLGLGNPSLADAIVLGTVAGADFVAAVGCLEQAAADAGFGSSWFLHAPVRAAAYLSTADQISIDGYSAAGAPWAISSGYPVEDATTIRLWATGPVWAAKGESFILDDTDWRRNTNEAYASNVGIAAFDPCINIAIDVTVPACPVPAGS